MRHRRGGVDGLVQRAQADAALRQRVDDLDEVAQRASEAVEPPHDDDVARAGVVEQLLPGGQPGRRARRLVLEEPLALGGAEGVALQGEPLVLVRDPGVADPHGFLLVGGRVAETARWGAFYDAGYCDRDLRQPRGLGRGQTGGVGRCRRTAPVISARSSGLSWTAFGLGGVHLTRLVVGAANRRDASRWVVTANRGTGEWGPGLVVLPARAPTARSTARRRPGSGLGLRLPRGV